MADALGRKSRGVLASVASREWQMLEIVGHFGLQYSDLAQSVLESLVATPSLLSRVVKSQRQDAEVVAIKDRVHTSSSDEGWAIHAGGSLRYREQVVVP